MSNHWFLTGASSGIGRHLAEIVLAAGEDLTATARKTSTLSDLVAKYPEQLIVEQLDVTRTNDIVPVINRAEARRPIDILVNNAGGGIIGTTEEMSDDDIEAQIALNLMAPIHITRALIPQMRERRRGRIIQISSASGQGSLPTSSMYHAAKWGLEGFSECLRQELEPFEVFVTLIEPGGVRTDFSRNLQYASEIAAYHDTAAGHMRAMFASAGDELYTLDPEKIAQAIFNTTTDDLPPLRVTLGGDAFDVIENALQTRLSILKSQESLARSMAFDKK